MQRICSTVGMFQTFENLLYDNEKKYQFFFHICWVKIFQVEILKELRNSFSCSKEETFVYCGKNLRKILFYVKDLCTLKERWIIVVFIDADHIDCIMQNKEAIIGADRDNCCG